MLRFFVASLVLGCASIASAQVIFTPPTAPKLYNPFYKHLSEHQVKLLWTLSQHWCVPAPGMQMGMTPGEYYAQGMADQSFAKADLLPRVTVEEPEPKVQPGEHAGEISISPSRPHGRETTVDTSHNPKDPAAKGQVIITPAKR